MAGKTWFITGASHGFGREWAVAALDRGDQVTATARDIASLDDLEARYGDVILPIRLDVTDRDADFAAVKLTHDYFGRLDVIVNNAGYAQSGMVEEVTEAEIRAQLETNLLGALWVAQAALPYLRQQGSGHIVHVSSIGGLSAFPNTGAYHASQWALEGLSQSLAAEVAGFGVKVTLIVPTGYTMDCAGSPACRAMELPAYEPVRVQAARARARRIAPVDPGTTRDAVLKLVDSPNPPLRLLLGEPPPQADSRTARRQWLMSQEFPGGSSSPVKDQLGAERSAAEDFLHVGCAYPGRHPIRSWPGVALMVLRRGWAYGKATVRA